jgi:hypothetical protein
MISEPWDYQMAVTVRCLWELVAFGFALGLVVGGLAIDLVYARRRR